MWRALVILLIGALVGANIVYFAMTRSHRHHDAPKADPVASGAVIGSMSGARADAPPVEPAPQVSPSSPAAPVARAVPPADVVAGAPTAAAAGKPGGPSGLIVPVSGIAATALADTFGDARDGERQHEALDIMAPAGTPVVAAADGHVEKLFTSDKGGLTIYQFEPSGRYAYYYAHLERYAPGLAEKQQVKQGEVIGYVGSTGNANPAAPHLHFAIFVLGPERQWWKGTAIDPYPLLRN